MTELFNKSNQYFDMNATDKENREKTAFNISQYNTEFEKFSQALQIGKQFHLLPAVLGNTHL